jgi:hypothetical protein
MNLVKAKWDINRDFSSDFPCLNKKQCLLPISFYATEKHYLEHLIPVAKEFLSKAPSLFKGFYVPRILSQFVAEAGIPFIEVPGRSGPPPAGMGPVICSAIGNIRMAADWVRPLILMAHGCDITYAGIRGSSYAGGGGARHALNLMLLVNEAAYEKEIASNTTGKSVIIGCPKMDKYFTNPISIPPAKKPIVVFSTHFDCGVCPETRSAFFYYEEKLKDLAKVVDLRGHYHPRMRGIKERFIQRNIPVIDSFDEVMKTAHLYIIDNSSTLYEFAATDRPVVALNCPLYRRDVHHGLRFWDNIPGLQCDESSDLINTVLRALEDTEDVKEMRKKATKAAFTFTDGSASRRAVNAILEWREQYS